MRPPMNKPRKGSETLLRGTELGRWILASVLIALVPTLVGCDSSRPPVPRNPIARHYARLEGSRIVEAAVEAHGGYDIWQHKADVRFEITDRWRGLAGRWVRPWPGEQAIGTFEAMLDEGYGRVTIAGERGELVYGIGPTGAWATIGGQMSQDQDDTKVSEAVVPAYLFFFEMPFCFLEYDAVHHFLRVAPAPPGDPVYEVLITYPWTQPEYAGDWFIARFDTATYRLRSVTYTASRWGPTLLEYTDELSQFEEVDSLLLATRHSVQMTRPFRPGLHRWQVRNIEFNTGMTDSLFLGPAGLFGRVTSSGEEAQAENQEETPSGSS